MRISDWSSDVCSSDLNVNVIDPDYTSYSIQQGQYESRGLELEGRWNIARNFRVHGAYAYIDSEVTRTSAAALDTPGKQIPLQPQPSASLAGDVTITLGSASCRDRECTDGRISVIA